MSYGEVATVARALRALEYLAEEPLSASELSRKLEVDRGTASRLLSTLEAAGYAKRPEAGNRYEISPSRIVALYGLVEGRAELTRIARPFLSELRDSTEETAHLGVLADDEIVVIGMERSNAMLSASIGLGRRVGIHCTALGKAFAAFLPANQLAEILKRKGMVAHTPRTITSPEGLQAHLERVRRLGYAVDDEESGYEVRCIAAPARGQTGRVVASLGIIGPSARITLRKVDELSELVVSAATRLSATLGWDPRPSSPAKRLGPAERGCGEQPAEDRGDGPPGTDGASLLLRNAT